MPHSKEDQGHLMETPKLSFLSKNVSALFFFFFGLSVFFRAAPAAHGGSQARGPIGDVASGLHQSHSNLGSKPRL